MNELGVLCPCAGWQWWRTQRLPVTQNNRPLCIYTYGARSSLPVLKLLVMQSTEALFGLKEVSHLKWFYYLFFFFFLRVNKLLSTCHLGVIFARWSAEVSFPSLYLKIQHGIWVLGKLFSLTLKLCGTGKWKALPVPSTQDQYSCHGNLVLCSNSTWTVFGALVWSKEVLWPSRKSREVVWGFKMLLVHLLLNPGGFFA